MYFKVIALEKIRNKKKGTEALIEEMMQLAGIIQPNVFLRPINDEIDFDKGQGKVFVNKFRKIILANALERIKPYLEFKYINFIDQLSAIIVLRSADIGHINDFCEKHRGILHNFLLDIVLTMIERKILAKKELRKDTKYYTKWYTKYLYFASHSLNNIYMKKAIKFFYFFVNDNIYQKEKIDRFVNTIIAEEEIRNIPGYDLMLNILRFRTDGLVKRNFRDKFLAETEFLKRCLRVIPYYLEKRDEIVFNIKDFKKKYLIELPELWMYAIDQTPYEYRSTIIEYIRKLRLKYKR